MLFQKNKVTLALAFVLGLTGLMAGIFVFQQLQNAKHLHLSEFHGAYLEKPRTIKQFSIKGINNKPFNNESLQGKWTFVFFGFTRCGSVCPTTMAELAKMQRIIEKKKLTLPQVVMVTIDPERDSLARLKNYVQAFHPDFLGARGKESRIEALTAELGIAYAKIAKPSETDSDNYDVQHSGAIMLFNPQGQLNAFFTTPHKANVLAKDYALLVS